MIQVQAIYRLSLLGVLAGCCCPVASTAAEPVSKPPAVDAETRDDYLRHYGELAEAVAQIELNSAAPVDRDRLFRAALRGMLSELDPYSSYLPPEKFAQLKKLAEEALPTTGVEFAVEQGRMVVLGVRPGSPAEQAGVLPGQLVVELNGESTERMSLTHADDLAHGDGVTLELVLRSGPQGESRELTLTTRRLTTPSVVNPRRLPSGVGYARVVSFNANTAGELRSAVDGLRSQGAEALVLDLRFNPGGLLEAAVDVADLFLESGEIVSVVGRSQSPRVISATEGDLTEGMPLAVLVNRYSASASEVLAAALQDHGRAVIVGERTFGKGSVQSVIPLDSARSGLKLTTAAYRRPSGKNIHRFPHVREDEVWGVWPNTDAALALPADEARRLLASLNDPESETAIEDRQLDLAVSLLKPAGSQESE